MQLLGVDMMDTAAGIYARIAFPDAPSRTEPHLSEMQKAMLDATPDCIKVVSVDGRLLTMNRAGCLALNVPEDSAFGMPWLPLLPEDVQPAGAMALRDAANGKSARFPGRSVSPGSVQYWDNLLTPLVDTDGRVLSILCVSREVTAQRQLEKQLEDAVQREKLLSGEMKHRIKNLFSVVAGLIRLAEKEAVAEKAPATATKILREKLWALSRASDTVFAAKTLDGETSTGETSDHIDLGALVRSVLEPYGERCAIDGPGTSVCHNMTTTLALFLHELATNSVKYGALGGDSGSVAVCWAANDRALDLTWTETGGPQVSASPDHRGFGSDMVERIVRSAGGTIERSWRAEGLVADLHLPRSGRA